MALTLLRPRPAAEDPRRDELARHLAARGWCGVVRTPSADLVDLDGCAALAAIPDAAAPVAADAVAACLERELGAPSEELFASLDGDAESSRLLWQTHRGVPRGRGHAALVRVRRSDVDPAMAAEAAYLSLLRDGWPGSEETVAAAIDDFQAALAARLDVAHERAALAAVRRALRRRDGDPAVRVVEPLEELSRGALLTVPALAGRRCGIGEPKEGRRHAERSPAGFDRARHLALAWAELAFEHDWLVIEADLVEGEDGAAANLTIVGGDVLRLAPTARKDLFEYLAATAEHDLDLAYDALRPQLVALPGADAGELARRLRQLVPSAAGDLSTSHDALVDHLLAHWRLVRRCGFRAQPELAALYRGSFWLAETMRELAPAADVRRDLLAEAVEDLSWRAGFREFRRTAAPRELARVLETYAAAMAVLPQRFERALDRLERGAPAAAEPTPAPAPPASDGGVAAGALGLLMVAIALVGGKLAAVLPDQRPWIEPVFALLFAGVGAWLLRRIVRGAARGNR